MAKNIYINLQTPCWEWLKGKNRDGYGYLKSDDKFLRAPRFFYEQFIGKIPKNKVIDHLCRNRICVNPQHLEIVSVGENIRRGLNAKLNWEVIKEIKELYTIDKLYQHQIGKIFGVGQDEISRIINGRRWVQ